MLLSFMMTQRQQRILSTALLFPEAYLSLSDFLKNVGPGHGATQRYLKQLIAESVIIMDTDLPTPRYTANTAHPLYAELRALLEKAVETKQVQIGISQTS